MPVNSLPRTRMLLLGVWLVELAVATYYCLMPAARLGTVPGSDKLWHWGGYLLLALPIPFLVGARARVWAAGAALVAYGVALEFAQEFVPGRSFELADMVANSAGVLSGTIAGLWLRGVMPAIGPWRTAVE
jgi:VanZ family protein